MFRTKMWAVSQDGIERRDTKQSTTIFHERGHLNNVALRVSMGLQRTNTSFYCLHLMS